MLMWNRYSEKQAAIRDLFKMGATLAVLILGTVRRLRSLASGPNSRETEAPSRNPFLARIWSMVS
jgi:hypothetical protein